MSKHTLVIHGDDGNLYKVSGDELEKYKMDASDPEAEKAKAGFAAGVHRATVSASEDPHGSAFMCIFAAADEQVHFVNLASSADPDKD